MTVAPPHSHRDLAAGHSTHRDPRGGGLRPVAQVRLVPPVAVVTVRGEIDMHTADQFAAAVELADSSAMRSVVVDLRATEFFDSAGVAVLCDLVAHVAGTGRSVHVTGARPTVRAIFDITGLAPLLNEESMPSLEEALPLVAL